MGFQDGINAGIVWFVAGWLGTGFDGDLYGITLGIDKLVELGLSGRYFDVFNHVNIEGLVTGLQDDINGEVNLCVSGGLDTGFYGDADGITLGIDKII